MWIYDLRTLAILEVNQAAVDSYGYSHADFLGMTILEIRPTSDVRKVLRAAIQDHPSTGKVWRHQKQNGAIIYAQVTSTEIEFRGQPARLVTAIEVKQPDPEGRHVPASPDPTNKNAKTSAAPTVNSEPAR